MPHVQAALKNDNPVPDALQCYWIRKVADRWYANIGKYDARTKTRRLERVCDDIREEILNKTQPWMRCGKYIISTLMRS